MEELKRLLLQTDEEYLIGLSNKGTVKRAYKDLEQETPSVTWDGEEAEAGRTEVEGRAGAGGGRNARPRAATTAKEPAQARTARKSSVRFIRLPPFTGGQREFAARKTVQLIQAFQNVHICRKAQQVGAVKLLLQFFQGVFHHVQKVKEFLLHGAGQNAGTLAFYIVGQHLFEHGQVVVEKFGELLLDLPVLRRER